MSTTVQSLATLKDFRSRHRDRPADRTRPGPRSGNPGQANLRALRSVGPRLGTNSSTGPEVSAAQVRKDGTQALSYIPGKGNSSLPVSTPDLNPNLVRIYLDAQQDYLEDRVYLLGALVVARKDGTPVGRKAVVRLTDGPPDTVAKELQPSSTGPVNWCGPSWTWLCPCVPAGEKKSAPLHIIFFDHYEQRLMLEALARNFPTIIQNTLPLYDFLDADRRLRLAHRQLSRRGDAHLQKLPHDVPIPPIGVPVPSNSTGTHPTSSGSCSRLGCLSTWGNWTSTGHRSGSAHAAPAPPPVRCRWSTLIPPRGRTAKAGTGQVVTSSPTSEV